MKADFVVGVADIVWVRDGLIESLFWGVTGLPCKETNQIFAPLLIKRRFTPLPSWIYVSASVSKLPFFFITERDFSMDILERKEEKTLTDTSTSHTQSPCLKNGNNCFKSFQISLHIHLHHPSSAIGDYKYLAKIFLRPPLIDRLFSVHRVGMQLLVYNCNRVFPWVCGYFLGSF